jgi:hypothetical protein
MTQALFIAATLPRAQDPNVGTLLRVALNRGNNV